MNLARKRLTRRLVALFVLPTAVCLLVYGLVSFQLWRTALFDNAERELTDHTASLHVTLETWRAPLPEDELSLMVNRISETETVHAVALYDPSGRRVACSQLSLEATMRVDEIAQSVLAGPSVYAALEPLPEENVLLRAERISGRTDVGVLVVLYNIRRLEAEEDDALMHIAVVGAIIAAMIGALSLWLSRQLGRGLGDLVHAAENVGRGNLDVRVAGRPRMLELGRVGAAFNDMTEALRSASADLERAEAVRRTLALRLQHAQALSIAGQVASSLAHEIGSPLSTILGWSRLAASDERVPTDVREQLDTIAAQSERISRVVARMLSLVQAPEDEKRAERIQDAVREAAAFLAPDLRKRGIALTLDLDDQAPPVIAARDALLQVVLNLCLNAVQAQPGGGVVRIRVTVEAVETRPAVLLEIADAGPGIPASDRATVLEPFYSTKRARGGTGLGLPIVADIVRDLGGRMHLGEAPEGGLLVRIIVPVETETQGRRP